MKRHNQIPSLDGLRAISILLVLIYHSEQTWPSKSAAHWADFFPLGRVGVGTFFVISGYLITFLLLKEWNKKGTIDLRGFYTRRILRIFPAFYSYILVVTMLVAFGAIATSWPRILAAATFTTNYFHLANPHDPNDKFRWFVGHTWSLSLEEQFYLLWPVTLLLAGPGRGKKIATALVVLAPASRLLTFHFFSAFSDQIPFMLHTAADGIMLGCLISLWEGDARYTAFVDRFVNGFSALLSVLVVFVMGPFLEHRFGRSYSFTIGITLEILSIATVLIWVTRNPATAMGKFLNNRFVTSVGVLSYSIYMWQQLFLTPLNTTWTGVFPLNILFCFVAAIVSYNCIEKPFLLIKGKLAERREARSALLKVDAAV